MRKWLGLVALFNMLSQRVAAQTPMANRHWKPIARRRDPFDWIRDIGAAGQWAVPGRLDER